MLRPLILSLFLAASGALAAPPDIFVAYPNDGRVVAFDHVLLEGSVPAGASLTLDGRPIDVGSDGLFIEWVPLRTGPNLLVLESRLGSETSRRELRVVSQPVLPLPETPTAIVAGSVQPAENRRVHDSQGATVQVSFRGSPGGRASFTVGGRGPYPMLERNPENFPGSVDPQDPAAARRRTAGIYEGSLVLAPGERLEESAVTVSLTGRDGRTVTQTAAGRVAALPAAQPRVGMTTGTAVIRNAPGRAYILYPKAGIKFVISGEDGNTYLSPIAPGQSVAILKNQVRLLPEGAAVPRVFFSTIRTERKDGLTEVRFELPDLVPFSVEQSAQPGHQRLTVRLYNTFSDVDYIISDFPDEVVRDIRWVQEQDGVFRAEIDLRGNQQWGYTTAYQGSTLVLGIKHPPRVNRSRPLEGRRITVDPGHGGSEFGGAGSLRVPEKDIVLDISLRLARKLEARGAHVTLTRTADVTVPLAERPLIAERSGAEVLISVHANAIPDGVDPRRPKGAGVYYFHPQARFLADTLQRALLEGVPQVGNDGVHYQNLALTRPAAQLSVLVETAFLTHKENLRLLMSNAGKERLAESMAVGLERFFAFQNH
ncbi:N-acetylmuramoyl-L-alanine amidase [Deinobacterium chartae]|uniref:N-acetylmuramoyl-L-alanine amidase n=1 Tax=Deinobacterium chartae TaxID=521158 RepID=A0A841I076_9DEIO|nr:N-acetylmuramoyl-L-alanine amidase [Deinobacterium chartae]MBB6097839.1 N-acetylmuramoyl-L-alanine amidase [Deinobacterium chartae]